ncbi:MAG: lipopolysaccharide biosynthesis protein [Verrucomicrobiota bacterium]|nr:lipopolysaccharide biosynthesis protein [Verrucomicrobiota bacterium]
MTGATSFGGRRRATPETPCPAFREANGEMAAETMAAGVNTRGEITRLTRSVVIYGSGDVLVKLANFLLLPVFTAYLSPADYGVASILWVIAFLATSVFSLGLTAAMGPCFYADRSAEHKAATIWTSMAILLAGALCLVAVAELLSCRISGWAFGSGAHAHLVRLTLWTAALTILVDPLHLYLRFEERARTVVILGVTSSLATIGLGVLFVVALRRGVTGLIEAGWLGRMVTLAMFLWPVARELRPHVSRDIGRELLKMGLPLLPSFCFIFILQHGSKWALQRTLGSGTLGVYQVGFSMGMLMGIVVSAFQSAWYPYFMSFSERLDEAKGLFGRVLAYYLLSAGGLGILFFIWARPVVMLMATDEFHGAFQAVGLVAFGQVLQGVYYILLPGMYFAREIQSQTPIQSVAAAGAIALNLLMIPVFGVLGAALSLAGGFLILIILTHAWNRFRRRAYLRVVYPARQLASFSVIVIAVGGALTVPRSWPLGVEIGMAFALLPVVAGLVLALLTRQEREGLGAVLKRLCRAPAG